ncbi:type III-B CRISPR module RAMP protein Cmr6 [Tindallia magadiensis]
MLPLRTKTLLQEVDRSSNEPWTDQYSLYANRVSRCDNDGKNMKRGLKEKTDDIGFENRILNKSSEIINQHQKRQEWIFDKMKEQGITVIGIDAATDWRMVIGLGMPSVHDTSMALHHIYGVPYIPASALKGGFRSWVINEIYGAVEGNAKSGALSDPFFCHLFGAPSTSATGERKGKICFFDTLPKKVPKMEEDIMNVHYQQYYSDTKAYPGDYYSPIPVTFRPVSSADFRINLAVKKKDESLLNEKLRTSECMAQEKYKDIDSFLKVQMKKFLEWQGIGAKTALGYGTLGSSGSQDH